MEYNAKEFFKEEQYNDLLNMNNSKDIHALIEAIKKFAEKIAKSITTNQLRNIYDEVIKIETVSKMQLFRPKLAYIAARNKESKSIVDFFDKLVKDIKTKDDVDGFKTFLESVVAYHKYHNL